MSGSTSSASRTGVRSTTLDQIPDQELDILARRGFNALWLIGVWERSRASQVIKRLTGNPEAAASAYSLDDYTIADDLGGESAYVNLRDRAALRGIRLASDMVPNHMGIDSRWVIQHPDWFVQLPYPPFPAYSFDGPDLSTDGRVEIKIDDHYFNRSDAAVVFRRVDRWSGEARYVYHGNDGTSFPWNDTAQLNYLKPEVREAVIQTILHVARLFPIIRFDAAMTLTKQHYQRLWFPVPGTGGAIPSRSEYGLTKAEFDAAMPVEFWRELVDRVAAEVPGTLLLAEAFWLLEGYFVRTLGMHRVYNSAFMNMLRDEENANYRSVIKNTLEFDPEVLKRYVNFMNNPDERTAVDQFGKGDKYFGVCTMLATLPGLPMFGHGQIEGFSERYGMEYRRAYHAEMPDEWLVARHEREISPLLHRRGAVRRRERVPVVRLLHRRRQGERRRLRLLQPARRPAGAGGLQQSLCRHARLDTGILRVRGKESGRQQVPAPANPGRRLRSDERCRDVCRLPRRHYRTGIPAPRRAHGRKRAAHRVGSLSSTRSFSIGATCAKTPRIPGENCAKCWAVAALPAWTTPCATCV